MYNEVKQGYTYELNKKFEENKEKLIETINQMGIEENIIITNFVSNSERNSLIKNSNVFLFPSIFEGFGMPPIEAMNLGAKVITTNCTSLPEVTQGKCVYVQNPTDEKEWVEKIEEIQTKKAQKVIFDEYNSEKIARKYLDLFYNIAKNQL